MYGNVYTYAKQESIERKKKVSEGVYLYRAWPVIESRVGSIVTNAPHEVAGTHIPYQRHVSLPAQFLPGTNTQHIHRITEKSVNPALSTSK